MITYFFQGTFSLNCFRPQGASVLRGLLGNPGIRFREQKRQQEFFRNPPLVAAEKALELAGAEPMVDSGAPVTGQLHDLFYIQQIGVCFELRLIVDLQQLREGGLRAAKAAGQGEALRGLGKLPQENPHVLLLNPVAEAAVGTVLVGDEALVQKIPGPPFADMRGLAEPPLTERVRVVGEDVCLLFHGCDPFKMI